MILTAASFGGEPWARLSAQDEPTPLASIERVKLTAIESLRAETVRELDRFVRGARELEATITREAAARIKAEEIAREQAKPKATPKPTPVPSATPSPTVEPTPEPTEVPTRKPGGLLRWFD